MEEKFPDRIDSKFRYVLVAAGRAEQLMRGARTKVEMPGRKPTTVAMSETTQDLVEWGYGPSPEEIEAARLAEEAAAAAAAAEREEAEEEVH